MKTIKSIIIAVLLAFTFSAQAGKTSGYYLFHTCTWSAKKLGLEHVSVNVLGKTKRQIDLAQMFIDSEAGGLFHAIKNATETQILNRFDSDSHDLIKEELVNIRDASSQSQVYLFELPADDTLLLLVNGTDSKKSRAALNSSSGEAVFADADCSH